MSDGGLAVCLAETAFAGNLGIEADLRKLQFAGERRDDFALFSESPSRFVATVAPENRQAFEMVLAGSSISCIGKVKDGTLVIVGFKGRKIISESISELKKYWKKTFDW